ncbi:MAG: hypothetical protein IJ911_07615 [Salinivirgaceae bacterium]|nr:hypothetical protein [Salinivirgaceae bacterium]
MKKSILIALAVALAISTQGQVDEWVNPFKEYGVYECVQKQSKHEIGKWFLKTAYLNEEKWNKYPTLVNYNNETFVCMSDSYYALAIVLRRPYDLDKRYINVDLKYNAIHFDSNGEKTDNDFLTARVSFIDLVNDEKEKDLFEKTESLEQNTCNHTKYLNSAANGTLVTVSGNSKYICIVLGGTREDKSGYCLINNIEITFRDNDYIVDTTPTSAYLKSISTSRIIWMRMVTYIQRTNQ